MIPAQRLVIYCTQVVKGLSIQNRTSSVNNRACRPFTHVLKFETQVIWIEILLEAFRACPTSPKGLA